VQCKDYLYASLLTLETDAHIVDKILRKQSLQLKPGSSCLAGIRELLDENEGLFHTDYDSFAQEISKLLNNFRHSANDLTISPKLSHFLTQHANKVAHILDQKSLNFINYFLLLLSELKGLKIKLFQFSQGVFNCQNFGGKKGSVICLYENGSHILLVEKQKYKCQQTKPTVRRDLCRASASPNFGSETSLEDTPLRQSKMNREASTDKESDIEPSSLEENFKQIHQELFGDLLNTSDDSLKSIHSENLFNKKKEQRDNQSFLPLIQRTCSEFSAVTHPFIESPIVQSTPQEELMELIEKNKKFLSKVLYEEKDLKNGKLKFYSEENDFGFIIMENGEEIFVHKDDLVKASIDTQKLVYFKKFYDIQVKFRYIQYQGKIKINRKAVDVQVTGYVPLCYL